MCRPPDWLIYGALALGLVGLSLSKREHADAPPAPGGDGDGVEVALLGPVAPFDTPGSTPSDPGGFRPLSGTAFSISDQGLWVTARHVVDGCRRPAVQVGGGRAVAADVRLASRADVAVLITDGGPPGLPLAAGGLASSMRGFHPGFPQGRPGEVTTRLLGRDQLRFGARAARPQPVLAWAETGRTQGLPGSLAGLSGAPVLDRDGRVLGVTIAEAPRRGLIYTTTPEAFAAVMRDVAPGEEGATGETITTDNYGVVADTLRRDLSVARVVCLSS